jgi:hypothetical protein
MACMPNRGRCNNTSKACQSSYNKKSQTNSEEICATGFTVNGMSFRLEGRLERLVALRAHMMIRGSNVEIIPSTSDFSVTVR